MGTFDPRNPHERPRRRRKPGRSRQRDALLLNPPTAPTADAYRIANYTDGLIAATTESDLLRPHYDSGLKWPDPDNPKPDDPCWGWGIAGGTRWDGQFYRDTTRYPAGGELFWSAYFKPGTGPGSKNGYWLNFGHGWCHLAEDDPTKILTGASQRLFFDGAANVWKLVIEATMFVTYAVVEVWTGVKTGGNDPCGVFTRVSGCDPLASLTVEGL